MKSAWRAVRKYWWAVLATASAAGILLLILFMGDGSGDQEAPKSDLMNKAVKEVEKIRLEGEIEKAKARATAQAQQNELEEIEAMGDEDPVGARIRLSQWINNRL